MPSSSRSPSTLQRDRFHRGGMRDAASTARAGGALSINRSRSSSDGVPSRAWRSSTTRRVGWRTPARMARTASPTSVQPPGQSGDAARNARSRTSAAVVPSPSTSSGRYQITVASVDAAS